MFAVLTDAIECFQKYRNAKSRKQLALSKRAEAWILSYNHSPFSFENICETLDINPVYLRVGLLQWRASPQTKQPTRKCVRNYSVSLRVKNSQISV